LFVAHDWRDDRIEELERQVAERDRTIAELMARVAELLRRVADLEEKQRKSSRNSSKSPSSDTPAQAAERRKKAAQITKVPSGQRKPGGQPGHERFTRPVVPRAEVDRHQDCVPKQCEACHARLDGHDPDPRLHQVWHLPEVRPVVEQFALHALTCPGCRHVTRAHLPDGVPTGAFGPTVVATVTVLMGLCRLGKRTVQEVLSNMFGLDMSLGAVVGCQDIGSTAIAAPVEEAKAFVRKASVKHSDETSWPEGPKRAKVWLWTVVTATVVVFAIQRQRSAEAAKTLLGKLGGVLVSDRYSSYSFWRLWMRQVCWAHLIRDFVSIAERGGESARIGDALLGEARRLFVWWHRVRDGTLSRHDFRVYAHTMQKRVRALLEEGRECADSKTAKTCAQMLRVFPAMWLFVERAGIDPTNNAAEQVLRHAVLWRKICGGTHSELGSRFVERILTVVATLRKQERNIFEFVREACEAHFSGDQAPSLLPVTEVTQRLARAA